MATFEDQSGGNDVLAGYVEASKLAPIEKPDIAKVLKGYDLKIGGRKGKLDKVLYSDAVTSVLKWHKKRQQEASAAAWAAAHPPKPVEVKPKPASAGGSSPGTAPRAGSGSGATGQPGTYAPAYAGGATGYQPRMSNTSVATVQAAQRPRIVPRLAPIPLRSLSGVRKAPLRQVVRPTYKTISRY